MISLYCSSFEDHLSHVTQVLQTFKAVHLKVRIDKCQLAKNFVEFFGHHIAASRAGPNKKNIEAVTSFQIPTNKGTEQVAYATTIDVL